MIPEYRKATPGEAMRWFEGGWKIFRHNIIIWIGIIIVLGILVFIGGTIPFVGPLMTALLGPVFVGGLMMTAHKCYSAEPVSIADAFGGFGDRDVRNRLLQIGAFSLAITALIVMIGGIVAGGSMAQVMMGSSGGSITFMLLSMIIQAFWAAATFFGIPLVVFNSVQPVPALQASIKAVLHNWIPMVLFAVISTVLAFVAVIPLGLGLLLYFPTMMGAIYSAYSKVFKNSDDSSELQRQLF